MITCADGNFYLSGLRWSSWGGLVARAKGFANANDCDPYAVGHFRRWPIRVVLSDRTPCRPWLPSRAGRRLYYDRLVIFNGAGRPGYVPARTVTKHLTCRR